MAQLLVRNLDKDVKAKLQRRAKRNGRSMEEEVRHILRDATRNEHARKVKLGSEIAALFRGMGLKPGEEIGELHDIKLRMPSFEE